MALTGHARKTFFCEQKTLSDWPCCLPHLRSVHRENQTLPVFVVLSGNRFNDLWMVQNGWPGGALSVVYIMSHES